MKLDVVKEKKSQDETLYVMPKMRFRASTTKEYVHRISVYISITYDNMRIYILKKRIDCNSALLLW